MRLRAALSLSAAIFVALMASPAYATLSEALSLADLTREADHVVLITCVDERALRDSEGRIVTDYTVQVLDSMRGSTQPGDRITVRRLGGEVGDLGMVIAGEARLAPGEQYLVFLKEVGPVLRAVGMSQGVLPAREEHGTLTVHPGGEGMSLVQRGPGGRLVPAPPALMHPEPFEQLRERVTDLLDGAP